VEQLVARWAHNPKVACSSRVPATKKSLVKYRAFSVYILYSTKFKRTYVGFTTDLISRFHSHNSLAKKGWTISFRPWKVLHVEFYFTKKEAKDREKELKTGKGRDFIKRIIEQI
jgi:putative endonuclease